MADQSNRIGSSGIASVSVELLKQALGVGPAAPRANDGIASPPSGGATPAPFLGARGNRILPRDYPLDQLDRWAARGTYVDILV